METGMQKTLINQHSLMGKTPAAAPVAAERTHACPAAAAASQLCEMKCTWARPLRQLRPWLLHRLRRCCRRHSSLNVPHIRPVEARGVLAQQQAARHGCAPNDEQPEGARIDSQACAERVLQANGRAVHTRCLAWHVQRPACTVRAAQQQCNAPPSCSGSAHPGKQGPSCGAGDAQQPHLEGIADVGCESAQQGKLHMSVKPKHGQSPRPSQAPAPTPPRRQQPPPAQHPLTLPTTKQQPHPPKKPVEQAYAKLKPVMRSSGA